MRRTRTGEIATIVNKDGWAFAYFPNRDSAHCLVNMKKPYETVIAEAVFNKVFNDEFNRTFGETMLNESTDNIDVQIVLNSGILKEFINAIANRYFMIMEAKKDTAHKRDAKKLDGVDKRMPDESLKKKIRNVVRDTIRDMMWQSYKESYPELYADIQSGKRTNRGNGKYEDNLWFG